MELRNTISRSLGLELPGTLVFDCPTPGNIVCYILGSFQLPAAAAGSTSTVTNAAADLAGGAASSRAAGAPAVVAEPAMTKEAVAAIVAEAVQTLLGDGVAADEPLLAAGLDSLAAVELRNDISRQASNLVAGHLQAQFG